MGGLRWQLVLCLLATWLLTFLCLCKGIKSSGKVVYVTATAPYVILSVLLVRSLLLPGAWAGIRFYVTPDFKRLLEFKVKTLRFQPLLQVQFTAITIHC